MSKEDFGFRFKIGDRVTLAECVRAAEEGNTKLGDDAWVKYHAPILIVRARLLEECYGGVQRHYDCRLIHMPSKTVGNMEVGFSTNLNSGIMRLSEPELHPYDA